MCSTENVLMFSCFFVGERLHTVHTDWRGTEEVCFINPNKQQSNYQDCKSMWNLYIYVANVLGHIFHLPEVQAQNASPMYVLSCTLDH